MNRSEFQEKVRSLISQEISVDPENWQAANPFWGTCVPVALLAHEIFGGELLRAELDKEKYTAGSHYWNRLPDGEELDFTEEQFQGNRPLLVAETRTREHLLSYPHVVERYLLLKKLFLE